MARRREYATNADRQRAYRERKRAQRRERDPARLLLRLHRAVVEAAREGYGQCVRWCGDTPEQTAENIAVALQQFADDQWSRSVLRNVTNL